MLAQQLRHRATRLAAGQAPCAAAVHSSFTANTTALFSTGDDRSDKDRARPDVSQQSAPSASTLKQEPQAAPVASQSRGDADRNVAQPSHDVRPAPAAMEQLKSRVAATSGPSSPVSSTSGPQGPPAGESANGRGRAAAPTAAPPTGPRLAPVSAPAATLPVQHTASFQGIPLHLGEQGSPLQVRGCCLIFRQP